MTSPDLSFTIVEIRTAHLAFPDTPGYWEQYRRQNEEPSATPAFARYEFKPGWQTVYATMVETPLVRVKLADDHIGWGESNTPIAPEIVCVMIDAAIAEMVVNREFANPTELWDFVYDSQRGRGVNSGYWMDALAALDIAIWDALGKRNDLPVAALLDNQPRTNIPVYLSGLRRATLDERITQAKSLNDQGIRGAKIFQSGDIEAALQELDALIARSTQHRAMDGRHPLDVHPRRRNKRQTRNSETATSASSSAHSNPKTSPGTALFTKPKAHQSQSANTSAQHTNSMTG